MAREYEEDGEERGGWEDGRREEGGRGGRKERKRKVLERERDGWMVQL
jgi:hypothetical protein